MLDQLVEVYADQGEGLIATARGGSAFVGLVLVPKL